MKVLITPRSFGKNCPDLFTRLERAGLEIIRNETGGILDETAMCRLIEPCDGVILGVDPLNARVLEHAPRLRAVSKYGVGLDNIDLDMCHERHIKVSRTVGANSNAVADYAFAMMLAVGRRLVKMDIQCHEKNWSKVSGLDMYGRTIGIIGLGAIGKCVARRARGFEMRILASDVHYDDEFCSAMGIVRTDVDTICRESDFITLHCGLDASTSNIISAARIAMMKPEAILVNTARGGLIDEAALLKALQESRIFGAGLDVFEHEPPREEAWYRLDNLIMGSHCASATAGATQLMGSMSVDNLLRDLDLPL